MKIFIYSLPLSLFLVSCQKPIDFGNNPPGTNVAAIYTLSRSSSGDCAPSTINGTYTSGITLSQHNTFVVQADVVGAGNYTILTNKINGYQFSASGKFSTVGIQNVMLVGEGLPFASQTDIFSAGIETSACNFNVSVGIPGPAVYTLSGAPNACIGISVNGMYVNGVPLTVNNNVTVRVNVISIGTYTIMTNTIDGITFSKSGSFTSTGIQNIILAGLGTPSSTGAKIFTAGSGGCTFAVTVAGAAIYSFSGSPGNCNVATITGVYKVATPLTSANTVTVQVNVAVIGSFSISTNTIGSMTFSKTGVFTSTGLQLVVLNGSGTPSLQGPNILKTGANGCLFSIMVL